MSDDENVERKCLFLNLYSEFFSFLTTARGMDGEGDPRDPTEILPVRFHCGGQFDFVDDDLKYVGGGVYMSYLDRDKLSVPELRGFLGDHVDLSKEDKVEFHWLFPGSDLGLGLRRIADDKTCLYMADCISEGGVAEVYVEMFRSDGAQQVRIQRTPEHTRRDVEKLRGF